MIHIASTARRVVAFLIDRVLIYICFLPVWIQSLGSSLESGVIAIDLNWLLICVLLVLFYRWLFLYFLGGTIGKLMLGLRVVPAQDPSQGLGLLQSLLRVLTDSLSIFVGHSLRAMALLRLDRTQVADWVAETRVVQFKPRRSFPVRRWLMAALIVFVSGCSQLMEAYQVIRSAEFAQGKILIPNWETSDSELPEDEFSTQ